MKTQLKRFTEERAKPAARSTEKAAVERIRSDHVKRARQRIASGFYDSDVCLDLTVRRLLRDLRRPVRPAVIIAPGRSAERASKSGS